MARDGAGNYSLPSGNPVVTNTIISSSGWANPTLNDIAAALTQSLSRDGQTTPTADLTMGNFKLRSMANAIARTDAVNAGQIQDGGLTALGSVSGTDTITASSAPAITAYAAPQRFTFLPAGANTTNAVTLNINGLGAKNVLKPTQAGLIALAAGDITANVEQTVMYDGTQFQLQTAGAYNLGRLLAVQVFTASGTYTPTPGMNRAIAEVQGAGGGSGGGPATGAGQFGGSPGSSSGAYAKVSFTAAQIGASQTVTIGAAGAAGGAGSSTGGTGGVTSLGTLVSCPGGPGSSSFGPTGATIFIQNAPSAASLPTITSGVVLNQVVGNVGGAIIGAASGGVASAIGGISPMTGALFSAGSGAQGISQGASSGAIPGVAGGVGKIIIWEFA